MGSNTPQHEKKRKINLTIAIFIGAFALAAMLLPIIALGLRGSGFGT